MVDEEEKTNKRGLCIRTYMNIYSRKSEEKSSED